MSEPCDVEMDDDYLPYLQNRFGVIAYMTG